MAKVAVIGAAGYVGIHLVKELIKSNHTVTAITHENGKFILDGTGATVLLAEEADKNLDLDAIINLAYPIHFQPYTLFSENKKITDIIAKLKNEHCKIIHISSLAVFGFTLETPVTPAPLAMRRDYSYVESKLYMENLLIKKYKQSDLHILRIGNVWGPEGAVWTHGIIHRILWGDPVAVSGQDGFSNITDVKNVVSYISFLLTSPKTDRVAFHHLAEFSGVKWSYWIYKISSALNTSPEHISSLPHYPTSFFQELKGYLRITSPTAKFKQMLTGRFTGSYLRLFLSSLPLQLSSRLHKQSSTNLILKEITSDVSPVMSCPREFRSITLPGWTPPVDIDTAWNNVYQWMKEVGYIEEPKIYS